MTINNGNPSILNNIISYNTEGDGDHSIEIICSICQNRLMLEVIDSGKPFNPFAREKPDTSLSIEERQIGGLGIYLVEEVMDECKYLRSKNSNVVTLTKQLN